MARLHRRLLLALVVGGCLLRVAYLVELSGLPAWTHERGDEHYYVAAAAELFDNGACEPFHLSPLYTLSMAVERQLFGDNPLVWRLGQAGLGLLTALLLGAVARRRWGERAGLWATGLYLFGGTPLFYEGNLSVATIASFLITLLLYIVQRWEDLESEATGWRWWLAAGFVVGCAIVARPNAVLLLVPLMFMPWVMRGALPMRIRLALTIALPLTALVITVPATVYNYSCGRELVWVTDTGGINFFIGNHREALGTFDVPDRVPGATDVYSQAEAFRRQAETEVGHPLTRRETSRYWLSQGLREIAEDPAGWLALEGNKLRLVFNNQELANTRSYAFRGQLMWTLGPWLVQIGYLAPFVLIGIFFWIARWRREWLPLGFTVAMIGALLLMFVLGHYRQVLFPLFVLAAVYGAIGLRGLWRNGRRGLLLVALVTVLVVAPFANRDVLGTSWADQAYQHATALHHMGLEEEAEHWYLAALNDKPGHRSATWNLAILLTNQGRAEEAAERWIEAIRLAEVDGDEERRDQALSFLRQLRE